MTEPGGRSLPRSSRTWASHLEVPLHLGPDDVLVAVRLELTVDTMPSLADTIDADEARVRASVPITQSTGTEGN